MLVFYSGWGYWEYDCDEKQMVISCPPLLKACSLFELPEDAEMEVTYLGETIISYLLSSVHSTLEEPRLTSDEPPSSRLRFILCEERKGEQKFSIDDRPIIQKTVKYTRSDIVESPAGDDKPKNLTETERNTMLKLIIGMAIDGYEYKPNKRNSLTGGNKNSLSVRLQTRGISISDDTIRKYLKEAENLL